MKVVRWNVDRLGGITKVNLSLDSSIQSDFETVVQPER